MRVEVRVKVRVRIRGRIRVEEQGPRILFIGIGVG